MLQNCIYCKRKLVKKIFTINEVDGKPYYEIRCKCGQVYYGERFKKKNNEKEKTNNVAKTKEESVEID